ncbi:hypothetical protein DPMN_014083 [Dreissena polymorpha]|uniref:Uncharacterized protein n=1 Tax=Dreissena polymorpha TaxID=45954 RepID=A0A9D4N8I9_DREPO|nr:hypothetical protein DPMN_014083 [Dreissena polymorpha]
MLQFLQNVERICSQDDVPLQELRNALKVSEEEPVMIEQNTLLPSRISDWFTLRKYRITGSVVHRVCNFYVYKPSHPENIVKSTFTSAAMRLGFELKPKVLERYEATKKADNDEVSLKKIGLLIDTQYVFLAA